MSSDYSIQDNEGKRPIPLTPFLLFPLLGSKLGTTGPKPSPVSKLVVRSDGGFVFRVPESESEV